MGIFGFLIVSDSLLRANLHELTKHLFSLKAEHLVPLFLVPIKYTVTLRETVVIKVV